MFNTPSGTRKLVEVEEGSILNNRHFFSSNTAYCGVWVEPAKVLEIYRMSSIEVHRMMWPMVKTIAPHGIATL